MQITDFSFIHSLRVRWSEVDMQGVVFNGHYLTYFDVAFVEYWRATGLPGIPQQAGQGVEMFVRKATLEYLAPVHFDDELELGVRCAALGTTSLRFAIGIFRAGQHLVSGELVYVVADTQLRKAVPVPDAWRSVLIDFEKLPPQQK